MEFKALEVTKDMQPELWEAIIRLSEYEDLTLYDLIKCINKLIADGAIRFEDGILIDSLEDYLFNHSEEVI